MHRALVIDEILRIILQHLSMRDSDYSAREKHWRVRVYRLTLAYLARTCKAFSTPALDLLWERQSSLIPVLKVLPTFRTEGSIYDFVSPIEPAHWDRFLTYSGRIQIFTVTGDSRLSSAVYKRIFTEGGPTYLFPNLQRMIWSRSIDEDALLGFVSPSLRVVDIQSFGIQLFSEIASPHEQLEVLDLLLGPLSSISVQLECLTIEVQLTSRAEQAITQFRSLQKLNLIMAGSWRTLETFYALGSMQSLVELRITVTALTVSGDAPPTLFRSLRFLHVGGHPTTVGEILKVISSNRLRTLHVKSAHSYRLEEWGHCFSQLPRHLAESLTEFRLECGRGLHSLSETSSPIKPVATPILSCPHLEKVAFDFEGPVHASDDDIIAMVSAWRSLREFRLWFHKSGISPTLRSLASCAARCQNLRELELSINVTSNMHSQPMPEQQCRSLRRLAFLGNSKIKIGQGDIIGKRIHHLFPNLREFDVYAWAVEENETWAAARKSISSLAAVHIGNPTGDALKKMQRTHMPV